MAFSCQHCVMNVVSLNYKLNKLNKIVHAFFFISNCFRDSKYAYKRYAYNKKNMQKKHVI